MSVCQGGRPALPNEGAVAPPLFDATTARLNGNQTVENQVSLNAGTTATALTTRVHGNEIMHRSTRVEIKNEKLCGNTRPYSSGGKFPVLTLSYINTTLSQSAFRICKCYIIIELDESKNMAAYFRNDTWKGDDLLRTEMKKYVMQGCNKRRYWIS